jgi:hypothetical protein
MLNITTNTKKFNTGPSGEALEDFALFAQLHTETVLDSSASTSVSPLAKRLYHMENIGVNRRQGNLIQTDRQEAGDLLISFSNLEAKSQASFKKPVLSPPLPPAAAQVDVNPGSRYSFPISYRKRVKCPVGEKIYLGLSLFRSPIDIQDDIYNDWANDVQGTPVDISLSYALPFEYNIIYEPDAQKELSGNKVSNWQGIAGFSTNMTITPIL